jgi:[ribosomal protein S18]-alanine N-acetyltransferase
VTVVELRGAGPGDVAAIATLEQATFGADAWSASSVRDELAGPGRRSLLAADADVLVGYAVTRTTGEVADVQRVLVAPRARRRGLGSRLVRELVTHAAHEGVRRVLLEVSADNMAALACYVALGFRVIDRRAAYYRDGSDALVLQLDLSGDETEETW